MKFVDGERVFDMPDVSDPLFAEVLKASWPFSMHGRYGRIEVFYSLYSMVRYVVENRIPGDFVECGVWAGGMSLLAARTFAALGDTSRTLHLFDTFEGMPPPTPEDGDGAAYTFAARTAEGEPWAKVGIETVAAVMRRSGYPGENVRLVKGMVEDTVPAKAPETIAILRLDTDFYASTKHELDHLYPRLSRGGCLVIDDYGYWQGARTATDEYFAVPGRPMLLHRVNDQVRAGIKL